MPLWVGRYEHMQARRQLRLLTLWQPEPHDDALPADLRAIAGSSGEGQQLLQARVGPN
jgi:hypothetical protein